MQLADFHLPHGEMYALRPDIRHKSFQTMCLHGDEYPNNVLEVRSSVIINRLLTPVANKEETYGVGNRLVVYRFAKYEN